MVGDRVMAMERVTDEAQDRRCEFCGYSFPDDLGRYGCPNCEASPGLDLSGFGLGVLSPLSAGVRAELGLGDTREPLTARRLGAVVPGGLTKGIESRAEFRSVHAALSHTHVIVSNKALDTVTYLCYNGLVG